MKRVIIFLLILFSVSIVTSIPTLNLQHEEIQPGETIFATIETSGEFIKEISDEDIIFLEGRKEVFFEHDIIFYNKTYYLYIYANRQGNFTIKISDILYKEADILSSTTIEKPIEIIEKPIFYQEEINNSGNITLVNKSKTEILSIKPGYFFSSEQPRIKIINKGNSNLSITYLENETQLQPSETKEIIFTPKLKFSYLDFSTYKEFSLPIIYLGLKGPINDSTKKLDLRSSPLILLTNLILNKKTERTIQLFNFAEENITITEIISDIDFIKIEEFEELLAKDVYNLSLTFSPKKPGHIKGIINITYIQNEKENTLKIPLSLFILPEGSIPEDFQPTEETCSEINGTICKLIESCTKDSKFTKGGDYCCTGVCELTEEDSDTKSSTKIIGIIILIILGIGGYYLYKKSKNTAPKKPEDKIKDSSNQYTKRISGGLQRT